MGEQPGYLTREELREAVRQLKRANVERAVREVVLGVPKGYIAVERSPALVLMPTEIEALTRGLAALSSDAEARKQVERMRAQRIIVVNTNG